VFLLGIRPTADCTGEFSNDFTSRKRFNFDLEQVHFISSATSITYSLKLWRTEACKHTIRSRRLC